MIVLFCRLREKLKMLKMQRLEYVVKIAGTVPGGSSGGVMSKNYVLKKGATADELAFMGR